MSRSTNPSRRGRDDAITPLSGDAAQYYLCQAGRIFGPIELTAIATWIGENRVTPRDWVFVPSLCDWAPILEVPEMAGCFYNPSDKPIGPPPGMPVEAYLKYYRAQQEAAPEAEAPQRVEKRQWVRIPLHTTMTFREIRDGAAKPAERHQAYTVNISEGGLAFEWSAAIATKTAIEVRVDFYPTTLRADAAVAHCDPKEAGTYQIGAAFKNLPQTERDKIRHFVRACIRTASNATPPPV